MPVKKVVNPRRRAARDAHGRFRLKKRNRPRHHARVTHRRVVRHRTNRPRRRVNVHHPRRRVKANRARHARNPHLVLMGLNPVRTGGRSMAKRRKYRLKNTHHRRHHRMLAKSNPHRRHFRLKNRRNPFGFSTPLFLETTGWAIVGGLLTRIVPQAAMPSRNSGIVGYGMNALTTGVAAWLAGKYKREAGLGVAIGGTMMIAARIVSDYFGKTLVTFGTVSTDNTGTQATVTPVATTNAPAAATNSLSQGDLSFDLRDYRGTYFPLPSSTTSKDMTSPQPWANAIQKLQAAIQPAPGKGGAPSSASKGNSNIGKKPTSMSGGRYGSIM